MYKRNREYLDQFLRKGKERCFQNTTQQRRWRSQGIRQCPKTMQSVAGAEFMRCFFRRGRLPAQRMTEKHWCMLVLLIPVSSWRMAIKEERGPCRELGCNIPAPGIHGSISRLAVKPSCYQESGNIPIWKKHRHRDPFISLTGFFLSPSDIKSMHLQYSLYGKFLRTLINNKFCWTVDFIYKITVSVCVFLHPYPQILYPYMQKLYIYVCVCVCTYISLSISHNGFEILENGIKLIKLNKY